MLDLFPDNPGRLFAVATVLPLLPVIGILLAATARNLVRPVGRSGGPASTIYWLLGGDLPLKTDGCAALAAQPPGPLLAITGLTKSLEEAETYRGEPARMDARWGERVDWVRIGASKQPDRPASSLQLGYRIDRLTAIMVTMVTVVGSLIFLFSLG